jgi:dipeptidyl aminopeptidase/acylaminoacyl peptidase
MKCLAVLMLLGVLAVRSDAGRPLALEDYYRIQTASASSISPDGRRVVFVRTNIVEAENRRHTELWIGPSDGSAPTARLTSEASNASAPRWSPDGKLLAFRSDRKVPGAESDIWFLHMDVAPNDRDAFQIPGVGGMPIFSPDNRWIAFTRKTPPPADPRAESAFEKQLDQRFKGKIYDWMNIRFDQRGYLPDPRDPHATPPAELYLVAREGGAAKQLTRLNVDVTAPAWRPDSGALALIADSHQRDEYSYERADLWIVDLEGQIRRVTDDGFEYASPTWSPDGKNLAFLRSQGLNLILQAHQKYGAAVDLYRLPADGGSMTNLTPDFDLIPEAPRWTGDTIYFRSEVGGDGHLFRMAAAGGTPLEITKGERSFAGFSFSEHFDRIAYTAQDPTHPSEAFSASIDGSGETHGEIRLSGFNDRFLSEVDLNPAERIHFRSKDVTRIEGWVVMPRSASVPVGTTGYPLILNIHGGPHMAFGSEFNFEIQWLSNAYAVLYTNPRGSTGYGEKFLWATWDGWGKLDYQDVMSGVDYAIAHYPVDANRLGVTGYSYGGFLTNWIITQTTRFKAAVVGAGISNWLSDYGTADIPRTKESEFSGTPWEQEAGERLRALSPITYAGNVRTPTLFVHGESDLRVPIEEGEQMYTALKKRQVAAKFIRYPGNYHGGWPPWDVVHRYYQETSWLQKYLE